MWKIFFFSLFFLCWFDEMCFSSRVFFFLDLIHLFRSFLKKEQLYGPTCVVHICVAWRVAFLFSYSDVGEHVKCVWDRWDAPAGVGVGNDPLLN